MLTTQGKFPSQGFNLTSNTGSSVLACSSGHCSQVLLMNLRAKSQVICERFFVLFYLVHQLRLLEKVVIYQRARTLKDCLCKLTPRMGLHLWVTYITEIYWGQKFAGFWCLTQLHACVLSGFSSVLLFATPWSVDHQAPLSMEFSRRAYWSGLPFHSTGHLPDPGMKPAPLHQQVGSLPMSHQGSPPYTATCISLWCVHVVCVCLYMYVCAPLPSVDSRMCLGGQRK